MVEAAAVVDEEVAEAVEVAEVEASETEVIETAVVVDVEVVAAAEEEEVEVVSDGKKLFYCMYAY